MHPHEAKKRIATGRMGHLCLTNSRLFQGIDFNEHEDVNAILNDDQNYPVVLYPGRGAIELSGLSTSDRRNLFPNDRQIVVFVLDGTWSEAKTLKRINRNLDRLPLLYFKPPQPSVFLVRKQPHADCYSTIEAIHQMIQLIDGDPKNDSSNLLDVFRGMVTQQLSFETEQKALRGFRPTRTP
jgi:DTW domain-containing protein